MGCDLTRNRLDKQAMKYSHLHSLLWPLTHGGFIPDSHAVPCAAVVGHLAHLNKPPAERAVSDAARPHRRHRTPFCSGAQAPCTPSSPFGREHGLQIPNVPSLRPQQRWKHEEDLHCAARDHIEGPTPGQRGRAVRSSNHEHGRR